jgi:hypothetical protein
MYRASLMAACAVVMFVSSARAETLQAVHLFADVAPNNNAWRDAAFADAADGSYVNMKSGANPGTTLYNANEAIVSSTLGGGTRLHWIYVIENTTTAALDGLFQVRDVTDWDGVNYTYDWGTGGLAEATADNGWIQPTSWQQVGNHVVGTFGNAWWAYDDLAEPFNSDGNAYNETDLADVNALIAQINQYTTFWRGEVRFRDSVDSAWTVQSLELTNATAVPLPAAVWGGMALMGLVGAKRVASRRRAG